MSGLNCHLIVYILIVLMFKNGIHVDKFDTCGLSISQLLPCMQPAELLLGWQS